jgi:hypothetical protein
MLESCFGLAFLGEIEGANIASGFLASIGGVFLGSGLPPCGPPLCADGCGPYPAFLGREAGCVGLLLGPVRLLLLR